MESRAGGIAWNEVGFQLAEGVANLDHRGQRAVVFIEAKKDRDGVEGVAEELGEGEKLDARRADGEVLGGEEGLEVLADAARVELEIILVAERVEVRRVDAEKRDAALDFRQLVEVEEKEKNPVDELVLFGREAAVHHSALVEAGVHCPRFGRRTRARSTAEA